MRILLVYFAVSLCIELITLFAPSQTRTSIIHNAFTVFEFFCVAAVYFYQESETRMNRFFLVPSMVFLAFYLLGLFVERRFQTNNYVGTTAEAFVLTFLAIRYSFRSFDRLETNTSQNSFYWFNLAFLVYFSGVVFAFLFSKIILHPAHGGVNMSTWIFHNFLNVVYNILLTAGVYKWHKSRVVTP